MMRNGTKGWCVHVLVRYGFTTKEIMVCLIINGDKLPSSEKLLEKLTKIPGMTSITYNINKEKTNVIMGSKVCPLWGQTYITDYIGNVKYQISPLSFYQVNPVQTEVLLRNRTGIRRAYWKRDGFGMCIVVSERFPFSLRRKHRKFTAWKSCRRN